MFWLKCFLLSSFTFTWSFGSLFLPIHLLISVEIWLFCSSFERLSDITSCIVLPFNAAELLFLSLNLILSEYSSSPIFNMSSFLYSFCISGLNFSGFSSNFFLVHDFILFNWSAFSSLLKKDGIRMLTAFFRIDALQFFLFSKWIFTRYLIPFTVNLSVFIFLQYFLKCLSQMSWIFFLVCIIFCFINLIQLTYFYSYSQLFSLAVILLFPIEHS